MADFFIDPKDTKTDIKSQSAPRKTKREQSREEYEKVCARMAELRARRKGQIQPSEAELAEKKRINELKAVKKPTTKKEPQQQQERIIERIIEKPVEVIKEVEKIVEKPVEIIKEVIKEVPAKSDNKIPSTLFLDENEILGSLKEIKSWIAELRPKPAEANKPTSVLSKPAETKPPEKFIFSGVSKGFKRIA